MNYHNILHDDMRNGTGLRVTLFVSGCENKCEGCQNPQTWDANNGIQFDMAAWTELFSTLRQPYISGITLSGGDPMHESNAETVLALCVAIKNECPDKTIWLYTGYVFEDLYNPALDDDKNTELIHKVRNRILQYVDVIVDGRFVKALADVNYHWAGSTNQRVIDVPKSLKEGKVVLYEQE